jgi:pyrroline-5-carboxylate reductase
MRVGLWGWSSFARLNIKCAATGRRGNKMKIILSGYGKMGSALLKGVLRGSEIKKENVFIIDPLAKPRTDLKLFKSAELLPGYLKADLIIYAVKPAIMETALKDTKKFLKPGGFVISISAATKIKDIKKTLGARTAVIRVMPNLPMSCGAGVAGMYAGKNVTASQKKICGDIFKNSGLALWVKNETDIAKITAVAGSAPAYFYAAVTALESVARSYGFNGQTSAKIARQVFAGAVKLMESVGLTPRELNKNIATPGGTTEAALKRLTRSNMLYKLIKSAADAAKNRF